MANTKGMEQKFVVFNVKDISAIGKNAVQPLLKVKEEVANYRSAQGKKENTYLVINTDEPYADEVIEIMKRHGHWGDGNVKYKVVGLDTDFHDMVTIASGLTHVEATKLKDKHKNVMIELDGQV